MSNSEKTSWRKWIREPFYFIAGEKALFLGLGAMLLSATVSVFSNAHFDGTLDLHIGIPAPWWVFMAESVISWLSVMVPFYILSVLLSKSKVRFIDIAGTTAFARIPLLLGTLLALLPPLQQKPLLITDPLVLFCSFLLFPPLVWTLRLLYQSMVVSANLKGFKAGLGYLLGLIIAEIASKSLIHYFLSPYLIP